MFTNDMQARLSKSLSGGLSMSRLSVDGSDNHHNNTAGVRAAQQKENAVSARTLRQEIFMSKEYLHSATQRAVRPRDEYLNDWQWAAALVMASQVRCPDSRCRVDSSGVASSSRNVLERSIVDGYSITCSV